eukprot:tig00000615_g2603.t1
MAENDDDEAYVRAAASGLGLGLPPGLLAAAPDMSVALPRDSGSSSRARYDRGGELAEYDDRKGKGRGRPKMSPEVAHVMGEANMLFANKQFNEAEGLCMEVIQAAPMAADPYHVLGLIHQQQGDEKRAFQFLMLAASLTESDPELWRQLAVMSRQQGNLPQAAFCYARAVRADPRDVDTLWDLAQTHAELGQAARAAARLEAILKLRPRDPAVLKELAKVLSDDGQKGAAADALLRHLATDADLRETDLNVLNVAMEMLLATGQHARAASVRPAPPRPAPPAALLARPSERAACSCWSGRWGRGRGRGGGLHLDLTVKYAVAQTHLGNYAAADRHLEGLLERGQPVELYADLYLEAADALAAAGLPDRALAFLHPLARVEEHDRPALWLRQGRCHRARRALPLAADFFERVVAEGGAGSPEGVEASLELAAVYEELGDVGRALRASGHTGAASTALALLPEAQPPAAPAGEAAAAAAPGAAAGPADEATVRAEALARQEAAAAIAEAEKRAAPAKSRRLNAGEALLVGLDVDEEEASLFPIGAADLFEDPRRVAQRARLFHKAGDLQAFVATCLPFVASTLIRPNRRFAAGRRKQRESHGVTTLSGYMWGGIRLREPKPSEEEREGGEGEESILRFSQSAGKKQKRPATVIPRPIVRKRRRRAAWADAEEVGEEDDVGLPAYDLYSGLELAVGALGARDYFALVLDLCKALAAFERYREAMVVCDAALHSRALTDRPTLSALKHFALGCAYNSEDYLAAYEHVRDMCLERPYSIRVVNLFNTIVTKMGGFMAQNKFIVRLLNRHPQSVPLIVLVGHHCLMSGFYNLALGEYFRAFRALPDDPLLSLSIALAYLSQVMSRRVEDRNLCCVQALAWLYRYAALRGRETPEALYNLARAHHQLGLLQLAVPFYERCLARCCAPSSRPTQSLAREAAHNLALIYRASGNAPLALALMREYLTI